MDNAEAKKAEIVQMIAAVDWSCYETVYGNAAQDIPYYVDIGDGRGYIPKVACSLQDLLAEDQMTALRASHDLWCGLCHQHAQVASAALPAFTILFEALQNVRDNVKVEILDIFYGFAVCTAGETSLVPWTGQLRAELKAHLADFQTLALHADEDIAAFAQNIVEELEA